MKKMLILAMAVVALMACKKDDAGLSKGEKAALVTTTAGAIDALGDSPAEVDAAMTKAGYRKIDNGFNPFSAPIKRLRGMKADKDVEFSVYAYGLPDGYEDMNEEEAVAWLNSALADEKTMIIAQVTFSNNKMSSMYSIFVVGYSKNASNGFTTTSSEMYDKLPAGDTEKYWAGMISKFEELEIEGDELEDGEVYTEHSAFVSRIAKEDGIVAQEQGIAYTKNFVYSNAWFNPGDEIFEDMEEVGFTTPFCYGMYTVATLDGMDEY